MWARCSFGLGGKRSLKPVGLGRPLEDTSFRDGLGLGVSSAVLLASDLPPGLGSALWAHNCLFRSLPSSPGHPTREPTRNLICSQLLPQVPQAHQPQAQQSEPTECRGSQFGCCYDNVASAAGPFGEGCVGQPSYGEWMPFLSPVGRCWPPLNTSDLPGLSGSFILPPGHTDRLLGARPGNSRLFSFPAVCIEAAWLPWGWGRGSHRGGRGGVGSVPVDGVSLPCLGGVLEGGIEAGARDAWMEILGTHTEMLKARQAGGQGLQEALGRGQPWSRLSVESGAGCAGAGRLLAQAGGAGGILRGW